MAVDVQSDLPCDILAKVDIVSTANSLKRARRCWITRWSSWLCGCPCR